MLTLQAQCDHNLEHNCWPYSHNVNISVNTNGDNRVTIWLWALKQILTIHILSDH